MSVEASSDFSAAVPSSSFGPLRQIDAGRLNVGYVDTGPAEGQVVVLLHGWPYDIHRRLGYSANRREFNKLIWQIASPKWDFNAAAFDRTAASFANPDHVDIVIHNYRWRLSLAEGEPQYRDLEARLFERPVITVPTVTIGSDFDGAAADGRAYAEKFSGAYSHRVLEGIGHNVPQEAPGAFTDAILDVGGGLP